MIRFFLGLLIVYGAVGGMDHQPGFLLEQSLAAVLGLILMYWGSRTLAKQF